MLAYTYTHEGVLYLKPNIVPHVFGVMDIQIRRHSNPSCC